MKRLEQWMKAFEWDTAMIALCCAALMLMNVVVLKEYFAVAIIKMPIQITVKTATPDRSSNQRVVKPLCMDSPVGWAFKCQTEFGYSYLSKEKIADTWSVSIRIESAVVKLTLPIEIFLPINPPARIEEHGKGHVLICERVYEDAEQHARSAVYSVFRRSYSGEGTTPEDAAAKAIALASSEFAQVYQQQTQEKAQDISDLYDFLEVKKTEPYKISVERAFQTLKNGQIRRL